MILRLFIFLLVILPIVVFGQKKKFKYKYEIRLKSQPSTYTIQSADTALEGNKCLLIFKVTDTFGDRIPFANININRINTTDIINCDFNGLATLTLQSDTFDISVLAMFFTTLKIDKLVGKANSKITIKTTLGKANTRYIGHIHSVRQLTDYEINKMVDDLSRDINDSELIKNKTCYVIWEI
jgi:hypothetical protein